MQELVKAFKALSNEHRLKIFNMLRAKKIGCRLDECCRDGASCVTDIARKFNLAQSTVSHHLKELYNAGLIKMEKQGLWVYCSVNEEMIKQLKEFVDPKLEVAEASGDGPENQKKKTG